MSFGLPPLSKGFRFADTMDLMNTLKREKLHSGSISLKALVNTFSIKANDNHHDAWNDTVNMINVSSKAAKKLGYKSFAHYLFHDTSLLKKPNQFI